MDIPKITLKEYITSYNYRKQLESHSRSKQKNILQKKTYLEIEGGPTVKNQAIIQKQVQQIKLYSRSIIHSDFEFAKLQKMLSQLLRIFIRQIETQRNSHNVINSMIRMSTTRVSPKSSRIKMQYDQNGNIHPYQQSKVSRADHRSTKGNINQMSNVTHIQNSQFKSLRPVTIQKPPKSANNNLLQVQSVGNSSKGDMSAIQIDLFNMKLSACKQEQNIQSSNIRQSKINIDLQNSNAGQLDLLGQSTFGKKKVFNQYDYISENQNQLGMIINRNSQYSKKNGIEKKQSIRGRKLYQNQVKNANLEYKIMIRGTSP